MAVPKRKHSNSRTNKRRAHDFLTAKNSHRMPEVQHIVADARGLPDLRLLHGPSGQS